MTLESNLINIVLVDTIHPGNIGSVARAMKTMGLKRLSLVNPRIFPSDDAVALSGNATDVLKNATVYKSIKEAIKESTFVYATSARDRSIQWPIMNAEEAANDIYKKTSSHKEISIIFAPQSFMYSIPFCHNCSISSGIPSTLYSLGIPIFLPLISFVNSLL